MIGGKGNPNDEEFSEKVSALFSLAYGLFCYEDREGLLS